MISKKQLLVLTVSAALLAACGNKQDVNASNFSEAIKKKLEKEGPLCIELDHANTAMAWPFKTQKMNGRYVVKSFIEMEALVNAGLATGSDAEVEIKDWSGVVRKIVPGRQYELTEKGKESYQEKESISAGTKTRYTHAYLCYGKLVLDKVVKWKGPLELGNYKEVEVLYKYNIDNLKDWAKNEEINKAFSQMAEVVKGAGNKERSIGLVLTSEGWE